MIALEAEGGAGLGGVGKQSGFLSHLELGSMEISALWGVKALPSKVLSFWEEI